MPLPSPRLDDRTFEQLLAQARARVAQSCPEWSDLGAHDPGAVLLEAFAHVTETLLFRMNRLPEKAYVEFLRLIGVRLQPPAAARASLEFRVDRPAAAEVVLPRGTRVAARRAGAGPAPVFVTAEEVRLAAGAAAVRATALHCEVIDAEAAGQGTGLPGQQLQLRRPPVIAPSGDDALDLVVGVEVGDEGLPAGAPARREGARVYRLWQEVESFAHALPDPHVYVADRLAGAISFAPVASYLDAQGKLELSPSVHAAVPAVGRDIRVWYRRGGGPDGNLPAGALEVLKDSVPGVKVTNPEPAVGGRAAEPLANALLRGPHEIRSLRRAVTAGDFEARAVRSATGVARAPAGARAVTRAELWRHAAPGAVEVLLVPELPPEVRGPIDQGASAAAFRAQQTELARARIQADLDARRPMGTQCLVSWARLKTVTVKASLLAARAADPDAIRAHALERLHRYVNPLAAGEWPGWAFGEPLARSAVYFILQSEPGVQRVDALHLLLEDVPASAAALAADPLQPRTWYAGAGEALHRSMNDGEGWEVVGRFPGEAVDRVRAHPARAGLLAASGRLADGQQSRLHLSDDCGETWSVATHVLPAVEDLAWMTRDGIPVLLLATRAGLYELAVQAQATPLQVAVDPARQDRGFWAVAAAVDARGAWRVAAAATEGGGVLLSDRGGQGGSFEPVGLQGEDVRVLEMQQDGVRSFLWAGITVSGADRGKGCRLRELTGAAGWREVAGGWDGGSCRDLAFDGPRVFAATHRAGVLAWDVTRDAGPWVKPETACGLRLRPRAEAGSDAGQRLFEPVAAVAARGGLLLAGGPGGLFRSADALTYEACSEPEATRELVPVPDTWLFCSGPHGIEVRTA